MRLHASTRQQVFMRVLAMDFQVGIGCGDYMWVSFYGSSMKAYIGIALIRQA